MDGETVSEFEDVTNSQQNDDFDDCDSISARREKELELDSTQLFVCEDLSSQTVERLQVPPS